MFENEQKQPQKIDDQPKVVAFSIPDEALHVMPKQYLPQTSKKSHRSNPNKVIFLSLGILAVVLALIIGGLLLYLRIQSPAQQLQVNTNINVTPPVTSDQTPPTPTTTPPLEENNPATRDGNRIKDITEIQTALALYFDQYQLYPQVLIGIPSQYLAEEPRDPLSGQRYIYNPTDGARSYTLRFSVENEVTFNNRVLPAGSYLVGPNGIVEDTPTTPPVTETPPPTSQQNADVDNDGLTIYEETSFGTNSNVADTDGDGFSDGEEVKNLYSPISSNGADLYSSGLIRKYTNTQYGYLTWHPQDWIVRATDQLNREIVFSGSEGDSIHIISEQKTDSSQTISEWYVAQNPGVSSSQLQQEIIAGVQAIRTQDKLSVYFLQNDVVYQIRYEAVGSAVNYPTVFALLIKSFSFVP